MIEIVEADIFTVPAQALVNPANCQPDLGWGSHISEKIKKTAGEEVALERNQHGYINLGQVVLTSGGNLRFDYIIHAAVLDKYDFNPLFLLKLRQRTSDQTLQKSVHNSLQIAAQSNISSLVFSAMGAGIGGMSMQKCAQITLETIHSFHQKSPHNIEKIFIAVMQSKSVAIFEQILRSTMK